MRVWSRWGRWNMNKRPPGAPVRGEGGVRGVIPLRKGGNGVKTVITDRVEADDDDELASVSHASNSSGDDCISIGD